MNKEKIIIFGVGKILNSYISKIDISCVEAFVDNDIRVKHTRIYDKLVIEPERINEFTFDYVVIFNKYHSEEIYNQLCSMGIPVDKILSWQYYIFIHRYKTNLLSYDLYNELSQLVTQLNIKNLLDVDLGMVKCNQVTNNMGCNIHAFNTKSIPCLDIYHNIYDKINYEMAHDEFYEAMLFVDYYLDNKIEYIDEIIKATFSKSRYVILTIPYSYPEEFTKWSKHDFTQYGAVFVRNLQLTKLLIIDKQYNDYSEDAKIFVVTHKEFSVPENKIYTPIHAGNTKDNELGYPGDNTGDNISHLNHLINECTALYWIWKNSTSKYVGVNHYRRYLLKNTLEMNRNNILGFADIIECMIEYDIITSKPTITFPETLYEQLKISVHEEAFLRVFNKVKEVIQEKFPDYLNIMNTVFDGYVFYPCNIFVTKKEVMDAYCQWLFGILLEVVEEVDVTKYDNYSKRILGFMAERLFTVWLFNTKLKIKELPMLTTE